MNVPKIQMVVLTHCGWSTVAGARNEPNQQTKVYLNKVYDIISKHRTLLKEGETKVIDRVRVSVNKSVDKCKNQLKFISEQLW